VDVPGLLYGSVGLALSFALHWIGMFRRADAWLFDLLHKPLFHESVADLPSMPLVITAVAVFCYGISFAVLDSPDLWRRVVLGVTAMVLTLAMVPAFAVWNVYFSPFVQLVGVFWSWFCVVIYTQHHRMPCDPVYAEIQMSKPEPELLEPMGKPTAEPVIIEHPHEFMELTETPEEKYKPKSGDIVQEKKQVPKRSVKRKRSNKKKKRR
jgi:hypothetical protein